jgi:carnitine 3-dehydrogenase
MKGNSRLQSPRRKGQIMNLIEPAQIKRIAILGAGTIGCSWVCHFLGRGMTVAVYDPAPGFADRVRRFIDNAWPTVQRLGAVPHADRSDVHFFSNAAEAAADAQFVQENGPETLAIKAELYEQMERSLSDDAVVASSTSGNMPSDLQAGRRCPHRYVVGHPANPPHVIPLVEVVGGRQTDPQVVAWTIDFYNAQGKHAVHVKKEVPGHLLNRLQMAIWREAIHLVDIEAASVEDVDAVVSQALGLRWALMGPHMTLHLGGGEGGLGHLIDFLGPGIESWWADLGKPNLTASVREKLIAGVQDEVGDRTYDQLVKQRDAQLLGIIESINKVREQFTTQT